MKENALSHARTTLPLGKAGAREWNKQKKENKRASNDDDSKQNRLLELQFMFFIGSATLFEGYTLIKYPRK